jgi:hypothetical protein
VACPLSGGDRRKRPFVQIGKQGLRQHLVGDAGDLERSLIVSAAGKPPDGRT